MAEVTLHGVHKSYGELSVIKGVDLHVRDHEFMVFVGPSGCGKSTLLRMIAGLEEITDGELRIGGQVVNDLPPAQRGIAMVFQSYALYPHMTVYENMAFGLQLAKYPRDEIDRRVRNAGRILQIEHLLDRKPKALSGGQRQRVAIGRAIVREPKVFLFDEPLSNLDAALRIATRVEIANLHRDLKATLIYVTHDQVEAMTLADRIVVLNGGVIEQVGAPLELYHHPRNLFVAGFIGSPRMNFVEATVSGTGEAGVTVVLREVGTEITVPCAPGGVRPGDPVTFGIRPEHLAEDGTGAARIGGEVQVVERLGSETFLYVRMANGELLVVKAAGASRARPGDRISVGVLADDGFVFDGDGLALPAGPGRAPRELGTTRHEEMRGRPGPLLS
ncbi:ABC transporter ATP-binding protein [Arenibaculum pallidiluteum]|uniref:ABC transporter ATP-binding protein n=1 Tax=Arenibaculum pallidiluteum TaxID=2812559 RepID=UPI001A960D4B|nr:sn-glycerol-3-phosphate ABC transporter ATP-binding protein UgpC [Arenibaculum pallidiluteum]